MSHRSGVPSIWYTTVPTEPTDAEVNVFPMTVSAGHVEVPNPPRHTATEMVPATSSPKPYTLG